MAEMETIKETVTIIDSRFQYLTDGIAKLNKKAKKLALKIWQDIKKTFHA